MTLGEKIRKARLERRLTQEQLAGSEFTKSYISELERGRRHPRLSTLKMLARRLDLPISYFREGIPEDREAPWLSWPGCRAGPRRPLLMQWKRYDRALH